MAARVLSAGTHQIFPCHTQMKVLLSLSHPALCCCTGFTNFVSPRPYREGLCELTQVFELQLAFHNRMPAKFMQVFPALPMSHGIAWFRVKSTVAIHDLKTTLWRCYRILKRNTRSSELLYTSRQGERDRWTICISCDILYMAAYSARSFFYEVSARQISVGVFSVQEVKIKESTWG